MTKTKYDFEVSIDELDIHIVDGTADRCETLCLVVDLPKAPVGQSREPSHGVCRNFRNSAEAYRDEASYRMNFVNSISEIQAKFPDMDRRSCPSSEQSGRFEASVNGGFGASGLAA